MAEFTHDDPDYDEVDASVDAAGFTDWSAEHDGDAVSSEQEGNGDRDGGLYYAESARGDQLIEVFVSPLDRSGHSTIEDMINCDKTKFGFDWEALMNNITSHKDELLLISIIKQTPRMRRPHRLPKGRLLPVIRVG